MGFDFGGMLSNGIPGSKQIGGLFGKVIGGIGGGGSNYGSVAQLAGAHWDSERIQRYLPEILRSGSVNPALFAGMQGITNLLQHPGSLSPTVADAIRPQLTQESQQIGQNFRNMGANQAGAAARQNLPVSIQAALQQALDVEHSRAQRGAQQGALAQSAQLQRSDLENFYKLLDQMGNFGSTARGQGIQGLAGAQSSDAGKQGAMMSTIGSVMGALALAGVFASNSRFKENIEPVPEEDILDSIRSLPVKKWSYKGEAARHIGPMAEDFARTFGTGSTEDVIHFSDAVGTLMAGVQALARKVERLEARP